MSKTLVILGSRNVKAPVTVPSRHISPLATIRWDSHAICRSLATQMKPPPSEKVNPLHDQSNQTQTPEIEDNEEHVAETPLLEYQRLVNLGRLRDDPHQVKTLENLSTLHKQLQKYHPPKVEMPSIDQIDQSAKGSFFSRFTSVFKKSGTEVKEASAFSASDFASIPKGLYLWGDVGCGKTMLMDLFYSTVPKHLTKKRMHFHQFMQNLHKRSHQVIMQHGKQNIDPIPVLAAEIARSATVLCFDEFQVTDVADAMLLRRLMMITLAPSHGLILFATSNREPNDLYINGIQRESFIPAIKLLETRTKVVFLNSPIDYRKIPKPISSVYYYPQQTNPFNRDYFSPEIEQEKTHHVQQWFRFFAQIESDDHENNVTASSMIKTNDKLRIWGRDLVVPKSIPHKIAQFTFDQLCGQPLAAGDYLALASHYESFIVTDIPYLSINVRDRVRRFITFLDAAYDNHCKLATTAANLYNGLFVDPDLVKEDNQFNLVDDARDKIQDYNKVKGGSSINKKGTKTAVTTPEVDELEESGSENVDKDKDPESVAGNPRVNRAVSKSNRKIQKKLSKELGSAKVDKNILDQSNQLFSLDEEKFAFVRALSRLTQMSTSDWVKFERHD